MACIKRICKNCFIEFEAIQARIDNGGGKFCNYDCFLKYRKNNKPAPNFACAWCNNLFYRKISSKKNSKSGLFFCKRECKDKAQSIQGLKKITPSHYGTSNGKWSYREIAFKDKGKKCERCGYDENVAGIVVHHIDRNRENNHISNLEVLCGTRHMIGHSS